MQYLTRICRNVHTVEIEVSISEKVSISLKHEPHGIVRYLKIIVFVYVVSG